jgi:hypothetical protein
VPAEHADCEKQDRRVQQFLADACGGRTDLGSEKSDEAGPDDASRQTRRDPESPALAAKTMPTISAASSTSRNTMMAAPSIATVPTYFAMI